MDWKSIARRLDGEPRGARARLAKALKMDRSQLAKTLRKTDFPRVDQAKIIDGFFRGEGVAEPGVAFEFDTRPTRVSVFGYPAVGTPDRISLRPDEALETMELPMGMTVRGEALVIQQLGSTMEPRIWAGERKLVIRRAPPVRDRDCLIEFNDGTAVLKTYRGERDGQVFAHQYDPDIEVRYPATDVRAIHAVMPL